MAAYDEAVTTLHQAPLADFVAERKRLAAELKGAADKEGAARLAKLPRPPVSAWAVNQLWWKERASFERLIALAARVKAGDRDASKAHREQLAQLREQAARLLRDSGNAAAEATLRRVTMTLSAIAAQGDFEPEPAGALSADRDPPGFEAVGLETSPTRAPAPKAPEKERAHDSDAAEAAARKADANARHREAERQRAEEAERKRAEEAERKRRLAERERVTKALRDTRALLKGHEQERERLKEELEATEQSVDEAQALLDRLEKELASL